ncbi:hypothetical protein BC835DRAFT_1419806 [Cytidiella melzeri]|nr:hypothetical protein BC835DRAFT_1419806 [Cytidiella melzeri]
MFKKPLRRGPLSSCCLPLISPLCPLLVLTRQLWQEYKKQHESPLFLEVIPEFSSLTQGSSRAMSTPLATDVPVSKDTLLLLGPLYAGALMAFLLFGISIMQLYTYSGTFHHDHLVIKVTVYGLFILDIFTTIVVAAQGWYAMCSGWGRPLALEQINWVFFPLPASTGVVAAWVQTFYAWRIYKLANWRVLPAIIVAIALMQCICAITITVVTPSLQFVSELHIYDRRTIVWLGGAVAADIIIAVSMLYLLLSARSDKFKETQRIINRLIRLTVETGVMTATCALMELIMFQALPTTDLHLFFVSILAKVYSNALMVSLNSRRSIKNHSSDVEHVDGSQRQSFSLHAHNMRGRKHRTLDSFGIVPGTDAGEQTVVHITTPIDRDVETSYEQDGTGTKVASFPTHDLHRLLSNDGLLAL